MKLKFTEEICKCLESRISKQMPDDDIGYINLPPDTPFFKNKKAEIRKIYYVGGDTIPNVVYVFKGKANEYIGRFNSLGYRPREWSKIILFDYGVAIVGEKLFKKIMQCQVLEKKVDIE